MKAKEVWSIENHICRKCGGRILRGEFPIASPGGNPLFRCADCKAMATAVLPDVLCWCGMKFKGNDTAAYRCLNMGDHPQLREAFLACGCSPTSGQEVGVVTEDAMRKIYSELIAANQDGRTVAVRIKGERL